MTVRVLRLPTDNLQACRVLCDALQELGTIEDHDGLVADRVRNAHGLLVDARGLVDRCLPPTSVLERLEPSGDPGCESCRRVKAPRGDRPYWNQTRTGKGGLCRWCQDMTRKRRDLWVTAHPDQEPPPPHRLWPPIPAVEWHRDTSKEHAGPSQWKEWDAWERAQKAKAKKKKAS